MRTQAITSFAGPITAYNSRDIADNAASDCVNARVENGEVTARNGFNLLEAAQANFTAVLGFEFLHGYSGTTEVEEYVSFETVSGNVRAYSGNVTTLAKTEIKNGVTSVNLNASEWVAATFRSDAYFINPNNTSPVYRHAIGDATSMTAVAVPTAPTVALSYIIKYGGDSNPYTQLSFAGIDVTTEVAYTGSAHSTDSSVDGDGNIIIGHSGTDQQSSFEIDLNGATTGVQDWTYKDKFMTILRPIDSAFRLQASSIKIELTNNDGSPKTLTPDQFKVTESSGTTPTYTIQFAWTDKTRSDFDNVRTFKVSYLIIASDGAFDNRLLLTKPWIGGIDMTQAAVNREPNTGGLQLNYSYYYSTAQFESGLSPTLFIPNSRLTGYSVGSGTDPLGVNVEVTATASADTNVDNIRFYVVDNAAQLNKRLTTQSDADLTYDVRLTATEIRRLDAFTASPFIFSDTLGMFAHKGVAIWLYRGGYQNIRWSRVGEPTKQASDLDEDEDLNRGATFSLADNLGDEPLGGVSVGDAVMIAGKLGVHFQLGDYGAQATPPRKVAGSFGVAGKYAFARWKNDNGVTVMVYVSPNGQVYEAMPGIQDDGNNRSLTEGIRDGVKSLKTWLLDGQGLTDYSTCQVRVNERDDTLVIIMGNRGLKLRRPDLTGIRHWEPEVYNLGSTTATIKYIASSSKYGIRWIRSTGQVDEDEFNYLAGQYVRGANRNGGNPMPVGYWRSKTFAGRNRLILRAFLQRDNEHQEARVRIRSLRRTQVYKFLAFRHWSKCLQDQSGFEHEMEIIIPESDMTYSRLLWEENDIGKGTNK